VPYVYWIYYIWANLTSINYLRRARGLNTYAFRPHSGEAGSTDHLAATYLTANGIVHGLTLKAAPVLEYLYYLKNIGIAMSPMSNNRMCMPFRQNPFQKFL
jgi:AMP deaminase